MIEAWKPIPGFERYEISDHGRVKIVHSQKIKALDFSGRTSYRYHSVNLWNQGNKKKLLLHKLVYVVFVGDVPEGLQVDHIDRDRFNNRLTNLRAVTPEENRLNLSIYYQEREPEFDELYEVYGINI